MRKQGYIGVATRPINYNIAIVVANAGENPDLGGSLTQSLGVTSGVYSPNRQVTPTVLAVRLAYTDPNSGGASKDIDFTDTANTVEWLVDGVKVTSSSSSAEYYVDAQQQLVVRHNQGTDETPPLIQAKVTFRDDIDRNNYAEDSVKLALVQNTDFDLQLLRDTPTAAYAGNLWVVNTVGLALADDAYDAANAIPWRIDRPEEWQKKCAAQLCDGTSPIKAAWQTGDTATPSGVAADEGATAWYCWYYRSKTGEYVSLAKGDAPAWLTASERFRDGTMGREVSIDLRRAAALGYDLCLVCRSGLVRYGEYDDMLLEDGTLDMTGAYREQTFHLRVAWPVCQDIDVADISWPLIERKDIGSEEIEVMRRVLVQCSGQTLIDPSVTTPPKSVAPSVVEKLFDITWYSVKNGTETAIGKGEWLAISPSELGATDAASMPSIEVDVQPRKSWEDIVTDGEIADGVTLTSKPAMGDVLYLRNVATGTTAGQKVFVKNDTDQLMKANIPSGWQDVAVVMEDKGDGTVLVCDVLETSAKYADVVQFALAAPTLDGESHTASIGLRLNGGTAAGWDANTLISYTYQATTLAEVVTALNAAIDAAQASLGFTQTLWAYLADADYQRVTAASQATQIVVQLDTWQDYRQYQCSGMTHVTWKLNAATEMPAASSYYKKTGATTNYRGVMNVEAAVTYWATNGRTPTANVGTKVSGNDNPVTKAAFDSSSYCAALRTAYGDYQTYIAEEFGILYPQTYGVFGLPSGQVLTRTYGPREVPTKAGGVKRKFPALSAGAQKSYAADGLRKRCWFLPGVHEGVVMMRDATLPTVNLTLKKLGRTQIATSSTRWFAQRCGVYYAWHFNGTNRMLYNGSVCNAFQVRPVSLITV